MGGEHVAEHHAASDHPRRHVRTDEPLRATAGRAAGLGRPRPAETSVGPTHLIIQRERLHGRLDEIFSARAGQVIGPSGSGKTTLLRSWSARTTCGDVVWMTIERAHRDMSVLLEDLAEAVRGAVGDDVAVSGTRAADAVDLLADAIDRSGRRLVIVLDDAHVLAGAESVEVVRALIALGRGSVRTVIAGRGTAEFGLEEIHRRDELLTIAAVDLRLDERETAEIVRSVSGVRIGDAALVSIHEQIGGWMSGAVLAGLVLRASGASPLVSAVAVERHRYFEQFFSTEVFDALPFDLQVFLLDTCVLDVLEPGACAELSQRDDATDILWNLERSNTFTSWIGGDPPRFRYHGLLRSWLRRRLEQVDPARLLDLDRRAASWFEAEGRTPEAIEHRLACDDVEGAAELIIDYGSRALGEGRYEAIRDWIGSLPEFTVNSDVSLLVLLAEAEHRLGNSESTTALRALLRSLLTNRPDDEVSDGLELTVLVQRGTELAVRGRLNQAAAQARRALSMIDLDSWSMAGNTLRFDELLLAMDMASVGDKLMYAGDFVEARRVSRWVVDTFPPDEARAAAPRSRCLGQLALCELIDGARFDAEELALEATALCRFHGLDPIELGYAELALLLAGEQVDRASLHATVERRIEQMNVPAITCLGGLLRAWAYVQNGDRVAACRMLTMAEQALATIDEPGMLSGLSRRVAAMVEAGSDEPPLGERELAVLALLATGCTRRAAADQLHLSLNTIKTYARLAYRSLGVSTLEEAVERCDTLGIELVAPDGERGAVAGAPPVVHPHAG